MERKYYYDHYIYYICYDPIEEHYFSGIPGYQIPTIFVGNSEQEVQESVESLLGNSLNFDHEDEFYNEREISYNAEEAYCSGWIIKETGVISRNKSHKSQVLRHVENERIKTLLSHIKENPETLEDHKTFFGEWDQIEQQEADIEEEKQSTRMKLISMAKDSGHELCRGDGIDILKVNRLGIQKYT